MKTVCVIPARLHSTRLPRKMLCELNGMPMIQMTYLGARQCPDIDRLLVATDSEEIAKVIRAIGGEVIMTPDTIETGSDRVAFVAAQLPGYDVFINLQGDEPFIKPQMLSELVGAFRQEPKPLMATLAFELENEAELTNPAFVKVISDLNQDAIYFSRSPIPFERQKMEKLPVLHHMGLYAYQRDFLLQYTKWPKTPLEYAESLEQLRALEHGYKIRVVKTNYRTLEVNTPEELAQARALLG